MRVQEPICSCYFSCGQQLFNIFIWFYICFIKSYSFLNIMNGPSSMYKLKPVFELPQKIELPTCMYKMKNVIAGDGQVFASQNEESDIVEDISNKPLPDVAALEKRWDSVLKQVTELKKQIEDIRLAINSGDSKPKTSLASLKSLDGAVINASPSNPPYSLLIIKKLYSNAVQLKLSCHVHSTVKSLPEIANAFSQDDYENDGNALKILLIWKEDLLDTELIINPVKQLAIKGEVNILRYLGRLGFFSLGYPSDDIVETIQIDSVLDTCHRLFHVRTGKEKTSIYRNLNAKLGKSAYFGGENVNICDIAAWCVLKQTEINAQDLSQNMGKWFQRMEQLLD